MCGVPTSTGRQDLDLVRGSLNHAGERLQCMWWAIVGAGDPNYDRGSSFWPFFFVLNDRRLLSPICQTFPYRNPRHFWRTCPKLALIDVLASQAEEPNRTCSATLDNTRQKKGRGVDEMNE